MINAIAIEHHKGVDDVGLEVLGEGTDKGGLVIVGVDSLSHEDASGFLASASTATATALETTTIEGCLIILLGFSRNEFAGGFEFVGASSVGEGGSKSENVEDFHFDGDLCEVLVRLF